MRLGKDQEIFVGEEVKGRQQCKGEGNPSIGKEDGI
jgi:hypothetical protein